jgi:hypothetical protein
MRQQVLRRARVAWAEPGVVPSSSSRAPHEAAPPAGDHGPGQGEHADGAVLRRGPLVTSGGRGSW